MRRCQHSTVQADPATLDQRDVEDIILGVRIGAEPYMIQFRAIIHAQQCGGAV